jgi:FAD binding domain
MDLVKALAAGTLPVTPRLVDIADSCTLCGACDVACHFSSGLRPMPVMRALKQHVHDHLASGGTVAPETAADPLLVGLKTIVGDRWATNDPAISETYATDPGPMTIPRRPRAVVLPRDRGEVEGVLKAAQRQGVPFMVRGNGSSVMGFVMTDGLVIDTQRMKRIVFDCDTWSVTVGAGVSAFELQQAARRRGYRVNVAEPAALVCANLMCSGIMSLFGTSYGTLDDNYVDAEFGDASGNAFHLNDRSAPNLYCFTKEDRPSPGICTSARIKLHPTSADETGALVPFQQLDEALRFVRELSARRIGFGAGVVGADYMATFMSPDVELARRAKATFQELLGVRYLVLMLGDGKDLTALKAMGRPVISNAMFRALMLGLPGLGSRSDPATAQGDGDALTDVLRPLAEAIDEPLVELLGRDDMLPLVEAALASSPETHASAAPEDLRDAYRKICARPEMTDLVWLNTFRILSTRMGREKNLVPLVLYVPLDKPEVIVALQDRFRDIAREHQLKNDFGFVAPLDFGKRAFFEYDYYVDHTNPDEMARAREAVITAAGMIEETSARVTGVRWIRYTLNQGVCRMENLLYT